MNDIPGSLLPANQQQLSPCSTTSLPAQLSECQARLEPIDAKRGKAELLACLTLVAPSGMTADDRNAWVQVARETLRGIPADLLQRGCKKARETCRWANEIVPTIISEVKSTWEWRERRLREERMTFENRNAPRLEARGHEAVSHEVTQQILKEVASSLSGRG